MTLPLWTSWLATFCASLLGMAKPNPMLPDCPPLEPSEAIDDVTPTTRPWPSTSAPPLLPGLIAASVWMALVTTDSACAWPPPPRPGSVPPPWDCCCVVTGRLRALTMPVVTVSESPSGLPMAMTGSPTFTASELPKRAGVRPDGAFLICSTARSVDGSVPTTDAL